MNLFEMLLGKPVSNLSATELSEKLKNGKRPLVLDVRQPEEYRSGHIAGAKLIPLGELSRRIVSCLKTGRSFVSVPRGAAVGLPRACLRGPGLMRST